METTRKGRIPQKQKPVPEYGEVIEAQPVIVVKKRTDYDEKARQDA